MHRLLVDTVFWISTDNVKASFTCKVLFNTFYKSLRYRSLVWKKR